MTDRRSLERRLADLEDDADESEDMEIIMRDTVIETSWSADRDDREVPTSSVTRFSIDGGE